MATSIFPKTVNILILQSMIVLVLFKISAATTQRTQRTLETGRAMIRLP